MNEKEKSFGQKQGGVTAKVLGVAHGTFRRAARHHSETIFPSMGDTSANKVKRRDWSPYLEGTKKPKAVEGEYNCFTITPIHLCIICTAPFS